MAIDERDPKRPKEPQSYGSEKDWLTGRTDQEVNETASRTERHDEEFYEPRHKSEDSPGNIGGTISPQRLHDSADPRAEDTSEIPVEETNPPRVSDSLDGRKSYFKKRDYKDE